MESERQSEHWKRLLDPESFRDWLPYPVCPAIEVALFLWKPAPTNPGAICQQPHHVLSVHLGFHSVMALIPHSFCFCSLTGAHWPLLLCGPESKDIVSYQYWRSTILVLRAVFYLWPSDTGFPLWQGISTSLEINAAEWKK